MIVMILLHNNVDDDN